MPKHPSGCLSGGRTPGTDDGERVTQEELAQLKELLGKAKQALPKAEHFDVENKKDGLTLVGTSIYVVNGHWTDYVLQSNGEVHESNNPIY